MTDKQIQDIENEVKGLLEREYQWNDLESPVVAQVIVDYLFRKYSILGTNPEKS